MEGRLEALIVAAILFFSQLLSAQADKSVRRVLIFNDFHSVSSPGVAILDQAIATGLANSTYQVELYNETLESTLFSDDATQHRFRDWYIRKYSERKPDLIITVGPAFSQVYDRIARELISEYSNYLLRNHRGDAGGVETLC